MIFINSPSFLLTTWPLTSVATIQAGILLFCVVQEETPVSLIGGHSAEAIEYGCEHDLY